MNIKMLIQMCNVEPTESSSWVPYHGGGNVANLSVAYSGARYTSVKPRVFWSTVLALTTPLTCASSKLTIRYYANFTTSGEK